MDEKTQAQQNPPKKKKPRFLARLVLFLIALAMVLAAVALVVGGGLRLLASSNPDGLEWKRDKWNALAKKFLKYCEAPVTVVAVKDRLLGHAPLNALYSNYYAFLKK